MKKDIHPTYHKDVAVTCACGNSFTTGSTLPKINIEICSRCHPFYSGKQKLVDSAQRIEKFQAKLSKKDTNYTKKVKVRKTTNRKNKAETTDTDKQ